MAYTNLLLLLIPSTILLRIALESIKWICHLRDKRDRLNVRDQITLSKGSMQDHNLRLMQSTIKEKHKKNPKRNQHMRNLSTHIIQTFKQHITI